METKNIMIVGIGGQGTLLASKLLGGILLSRGYDVKVSEVHGMSQRGGSVVTYVRYGERVYSPVIDRGQADLIVSFELLEAARWIEYLNPGGRVITNTQQVDPMPVITGAAAYPENLVEKVRALGIDLDAVDALSLAERSGSSKAVNIVLMGRVSKWFDFSEQDWLDAIKQSVPPKFLDMNLRAFTLGRNA
ncbi:MAG: indolepyruvate oxidoreductase subunit beta [Butyricicoccus sp.]|nr:indolepyruvate oxidoreductase subunit beta [Butyricicoccus sp.]